MVLTVGLDTYHTNKNPIIIFTVNFLAIIPLGVIVGVLGDELSEKLGDFLGAVSSSAFRFV